MTRPLEAALNYAGRGWHVFPVHGVIAGECTCGRTDCSHPGKHPLTPRGVLDATAEPGKIRELWGGRPMASVGLAMGEASGLLAIDIDSRHGGNENLYELERTHEELPPTLTSLTGGGGSHLLFRHPEGVKNQTGRIAPGIDVKSDRGYIIVPPSSHVSGRQYEWAPGHGPDEIEPAVCPDWLLQLLRSDSRPRSESSSAAERIRPGHRNDYLASMAGSMRSRGLLYEDIERTLQAINEAHCEPPLSHGEVRSIAQSISRYSPTVPAAIAGGTCRPGRADEQPEPALFERSQWPEPLTPEAYYGVAGEFVRLVEPRSEADPAALLIQFLVEFGSILGRHGHFTAGADKHYTNLFAVLVGMSSKGRKGSSESAVRSVLRSIDEVWAREHISSGLASGEGLIWQVRDPVETQEALREKGGVVTGYQAVISDAGVTDKRLLIVEPEFARVLKVCERESNTLSAIIRESWDNGNLRSLTKNNPGKATGAHISLIGHITRDELRRLLTDTATVNGFANRFLWVCTRRSKPLPDGDDLSVINFAPFMRELAEAVSFGRQAGLLKRDSAARDIWHREYEALSEGKPGLLGAATGRAEAQVMRLALIYALLDCSSFIRPEHLNAALAVWRYADQSAAFLFGSALGDPTADEILAALRSSPEGKTRLEIRDLFNRHKSSAEVNRALMSLAEHGMAKFQKEDSGGRPTERWFSLSPAQKATKAQNLDTAHSALIAQVEVVR